jgi:hypothetical protein
MPARRLLPLLKLTVLSGCLLIVLGIYLARAREGSLEPAPAYALWTVGGGAALAALSALLAWIVSD